MEIAPGIYIDATYIGSPARFINHSCEPNSTVTIVASKSNIM